MNGGRRFEGWLFDGRRATRRKVDVTFMAAGVLLADGDRPGGDLWPYASISLVEDEAHRGSVRIAWDDARLEVGDPAFAKALHEAMPELRRARRRIVRYASVATVMFAAFVAGMWWGMPLVAASVVSYVPPRWEEKLGDEALSLPIAGKRCPDAAGQAALEALTRRLLDGTDMPYTVSVSVRDSKMVNAFAFPGGRIVLLDGLLQQAQSPDEVAGVLAHEFTHALKRHSMRALIANAGLSLLFELTAGGGTGVSLAFMLTTLSYSRDMEAEADDGAVALSERAHIDSGGFAAFFERLDDKRGTRLPPYLSSHPAPQRRAESVREHTSAATFPALSPEQWEGLKAICGAEKK